MSRKERRNERFISDIAGDAYRFGSLAGQWGWSAAQWARALAGVRRQLQQLGADERQIDRFVRTANEGYNVYAGGGEMWVVVQRASGMLRLERWADCELDDGDVVVFRGSRYGAERVYTSYGGML